MTHETAVPLKDIRILNSKHTSRRWAQLVGNGWGPGGIDGLLIQGNTIHDGEANAIAVSEASGSRTFKDVTIRNNTILDAVGLGIFIGRDGTSSSTLLYLENVCILNNNISVAPLNAFVTAIYLRPSGGAENVRVRNNVIDISAAQLAGLNPHTFVINDGGPGTVDLGGNTYIPSPNIATSGEIQHADLNSNLSTCYGG